MQLFVKSVRLRDRDIKRIYLNFEYLDNEL